MMSVGLVENTLIKKIEAALPGTTPGLQIQAYHRGRKVIDLEAGETFVYYDLASVTKVIFTTQALMWSFDLDKWNLESKVKDFVTWYPHETKLTELMNHSSGLCWWRPFFEKVDLSQPIDQRWKFLADELKKEKLENSDNVSVYSDLNFLMFKYILESMWNMPILEIWNKVMDQFYSRSTFEFHPNNIPKNVARLYAPTERSAWRDKLIQGEVFDDNAWALGGVSTHAGLFGSVDDLSWYGLMLRSGLKGIAKSSIKSKTFKLFMQRSRPAEGGDWALGFMMPTPGKSSSGNYLSSLSVGHTGFTGTSFWFDPVNDVFISILSNRVFLGRENKAFQSLRPELHNWIMKALRIV